MWQSVHHLASQWLAVAAAREPPKSGNLAACVARLCNARTNFLGAHCSALALGGYVCPSVTGHYRLYPCMGSTVPLWREAF